MGLRRPEACALREAEARASLHSHGEVLLRTQVQRVFLGGQVAWQKGELVNI
jgi:hypothetical protein